jgi:hypothetical protein
MNTELWNVIKNDYKLHELCEKSGLQPYYDDQENQIKRFMELVVKECSMFTDSVTKIHLLKHFGIKEDA